VVFDAFTVFDPRGVVAAAERLVPGKGAALVNAWRTRQFEYAWLRVLGGKYVDFRQVTEDALDWAARSVQLELDPRPRAALLTSNRELPAWPDSIQALRALRAAGLRLAWLSNFTTEMLSVASRSAGVEGLLDHPFSTDAARTYKPAPSAYQLAVDGFDLPREQIAFAAFAGWDAAGAKWFGYRTFWINRMGLPIERLGVEPDAVLSSLAELAELV
jgi:2-haloacid dehalogenase